VATLTKQQETFLLSQGIHPSQLFDASSCANGDERKSIMDAAGLSFYFGGAACQAGGHTLRTKAGHCIQCDTSKIAFQLRSKAKGFVYLAYSSSKKLAKVGFTKDHPQDRATILRKDGYGNASDWDIKCLVELTKDAGKTEFKIHSLLAPYQYATQYQKRTGLRVECKELFNCELEVAKNAFNSVQGA
jgi:hypothetical protein